MTSTPSRIPTSTRAFSLRAPYWPRTSCLPRAFFSRTFFTYGHRNVIRAVGSGLAQSGSVDGYVYEVMRETEPELVKQTKIVRRSEWLGFPPIASPKSLASDPRIASLQRALTSMKDDPEGRQVLNLLRLDGFETTEPSLFDTIAAKVETVRLVRMRLDPASPFDSRFLSGAGDRGAADGRDQRRHFRACARSHCRGRKSGFSTVLPRATSMAFPRPLCPRCSGKTSGKCSTRSIDRRHHTRRWLRSRPW